MNQIQNNHIDDEKLYDFIRIRKLEESETKKIEKHIADCSGCAGKASIFLLLENQRQNIAPMNEDEFGPCPEPYKIFRTITGHSSNEEYKMVNRHIIGCEVCYNQAMVFHEPDFLLKKLAQKFIATLAILSMTSRKAIDALREGTAIRKEDREDFGNTTIRLESGHTVRLKIYNDRLVVNAQLLRNSLDKELMVKMYRGNTEAEKEPDGDNPSFFIDLAEELLNKELEIEASYDEELKILVLRIPCREPAS